MQCRRARQPGITLNLIVGRRKASLLEMVLPSHLSTYSLGPFQFGNSTDGPFTFANYYSVEGQIVKNRGNDFAVAANDDSMGSLRIEGRTYVVRGFHLHCPSEHLVDNSSAACEVHIVHQEQNSSGTDNLLVVAILFDKVAGAQNNTVMSGFGLPFGAPQIPGTSSFWAGNQGQQVNLAQFANFTQYFRYTGSLTTPPCSEGVLLFVIQQRKTMSPAQYDAFKTMFPDPANNRPVQPLNGRAVFHDQVPT